MNYPHQHVPETRSGGASGQIPVSSAEASTRRPLVSNTCRARLEVALAEIGEGTIAIMQKLSAGGSARAHYDGSLNRGKAGISLFLHYFGDNNGDTRCKQIAGDLLEQAAAAAVVGRCSPTLGAGFVGIAWTVAHLARVGLVDGEAYELTVVDERIHQTMKGSERLSFDLMDGLSGVGVYCLERARASGDPTLVHAVIRRLLTEAERDLDGLRWRTDPRHLPPELQSKHPRGYYSLGLAHGTPGAIGFLAQACLDGWRTAEIESAIDDAVRWLLCQEFDPPDRMHCRFPAVVDSSTPKEESRVAWCQGDLSVAVSIASAATATGRGKWLEAARVLTERCAICDRQAGVVDASFCHGASGVAHVFMRLSTALHSQEARAAAGRWYERIFSYKHGAGIAGFSSVSTDRIGWLPVSGLLEGTIGVGLAILTALSDKVHSWDRALLLGLNEKPVG